MRTQHCLTVNGVPVLHTIPLKHPATNQVAQPLPHGLMISI